MTPMKTYMGYDIHMGSSEGACLIFAHTAKEARKVGYATVADWFNTPWIDMAVRRLRAPHLMAYAQPEKLAADAPHVIDDPEVCPSCKVWGGEFGDDGQCTYCREDAM